MATAIHTVRLTPDNIDTELLPGDRFADDLSFGVVQSHRPMRDGSTDAMVYNTDGSRDVFGIPQTVRIVREV